MTAHDLAVASSSIGPRLAVELSVIERDAASLVCRQVADVNGMVTRLKSDEEFELELAEVRGLSCFEIVAECDTRHQRIRSATVAQEHRAGALTELLACLGSNLFTEFFASK